jgi:Protein of unknown function (DUF2934)
MAASTEEDIRKRAYHLWKLAGEPNGNPDEFWYQAEKEIIKENAELGDVPPGMTDNLPV